MKYDFTSIIERHGMDATAVDGLGIDPHAPQPPKEGFDIIPMWVADMNFPTCPTIPEAIIQRAKHPAYGYFEPREEYYASIIRWQERRNAVTGLAREHIGYQNGVLGGVVSTLNALCSRGESVLIHAPAYVGFTSCLRDNGYHPVYSPLIRDDQGVWRIDFGDMEKKLREKRIHAAVFCSPHNPAGRVWERWELERAMKLFEKYQVYVISDEIWSDLTRPGVRHIPTQSVSDYARSHTVALYAPSKTFNIAGLIGSYHIIYDAWLRDRVRRESRLSYYNNDMNVMSMHALIGAYSPEGHEWVDQLRQVLAGNVDYACDYIARRFDGVEVSKPQGTYMLYLDCTRWCAEHGKTLDELLRAGSDVGVAWQDGRLFQGTCHIRMNLALPLSRVQEAFDRLDKYVFNL